MIPLATAVSLQLIALALGRIYVRSSFIRSDANVLEIGNVRQSALLKCLTVSGGWLILLLLFSGMQPASSKLAILGCVLVLACAGGMLAEELLSSKPAVRLPRPYRSAELHWHEGFKYLLRLSNAEHEVFVVGQCLGPKSKDKITETLNVWLPNLALIELAPGTPPLGLPGLVILSRGVALS